MEKSIKRIDDQDICVYQYAYILYDSVQAAQKAIQTFDNSNVFGSKPLFVELWVSKEEKEQEKQKKKAQQLNQFISTIFNMTPRPVPDAYMNQQMMGQAPVQPNAPYNQQRGQMRGRGGYNRGRGGAHHGQPRSMMNQMPRPQMSQFPPQVPAHPFVQPGQPMPAGFPVTPQMMVPPAKAPLLNLSPLDPAALQSMINTDERRQFVGNHIYPAIEEAFGQAFAGKITGMLIDETVVDQAQIISNPAYLTQKAREAHALLV